MTQILLCTRAGFYGETTTSPVSIKTAQPAWFSYVGFPSKELGSYYLQRREHDAAQFDFVDMQRYYASTTIEERQGVEKVLYFRDEKVIDLFVDTPAAFPYDRHNLFIVQVLPPPTDIMPPQPADGFLSRLTKLFK